jgi:hypothetical protein
MKLTDRISSLFNDDDPDNDFTALMTELILNVVWMSRSWFVQSYGDMPTFAWTE